MGSIPASISSNEGNRSAIVEMCVCDERRRSGRRERQQLFVGTRRVVAPDGCGLAVTGRGKASEPRFAGELFSVASSPAPFQHQSCFTSSQKSHRIRKHSLLAGKDCIRY